MPNRSSKLVSVLLWVTLFAVAGYRGYLYYRDIPCLNPIEYRVGTLDPRFGVTKTQFLADIKQAGELWSDAEGKQLFVYNPNGRLTINLVYDDRQKITQQEQNLTSSIDSTKGVADSVKQQYTSLQDKYQSAYNNYSMSLATFNEEQSAYNKQVAFWNSKGGAPRADYNELQVEKSKLDSERASLLEQQTNVNNLADQVNALIDKYNLLVAHINSNVDAINNDGLTGTQFEEGVYISDKDGQRINIYQFNTKTYFFRVLAHEMGHALGLEHNDNPDSIMNPVNQSESMVLSADDKAALNAECHQKRLFGLLQ